MNSDLQRDGGSSGQKEGRLRSPFEMIAEENFERSEFIELRSSGSRFRTLFGPSRKPEHELRERERAYTEDRHSHSDGELDGRLLH